MTDIPSNAALRGAALAVALGAPAAAGAAEITITAQTITRFNGGIFATVYITDADLEDYQATLWAAGETPRYISDLRHWWRATGDVDDRHAEYDGRSGASLGRGETLTITAEVADELFDTGYVLRVDTALWGGRTFGSDVVVPLTSEQAGQPVAGRGYIDHVTFEK